MSDSFLTASAYETWGWSSKSTMLDAMMFLFTTMIQQKSSKRAQMYNIKQFWAAQSYHQTIEAFVGLVRSSCNRLYWRNCQNFWSIDETLHRSQRADNSHLRISVFLYSCILALLIILIQPFTTKVYDRCASGDCGTALATFDFPFEP